MKSNFALTLSFEGIGLLHRAFPGWHLVGEVSLDSADLAGELGMLRDKALALEPSGVRCKLVIPNDQIKYLHFDAEGMDTDGILAAVRRELNGATPYAIDDLAYDWSVSAGQVYVAAVARETLAEAEAFATEHRFNPLGFVAIPENRGFVGEPWFGESTLAASLLPEGGSLERDTAAIRVIGAAHLPEPEARDSEEAMPTPAPEFPMPPVLPTFNKADKAVAETPEPAAEAEPAEDIALPEDADAPPADVDETPADSEKAAVSFTSIRARRDDMPAAAPRLSGATRDLTPRITLEPGAEADLPAEPPITANPPAAAPATEVTGVPEAALPEETATRIAATLRPNEADRLTAVADTPAPNPEPKDLHPGPEAAADPEPSFFTRRSVRLKRGQSGRGAARSASTQPLAPQDEKQRMTIFGAREPARVGGKPKFLGIILTAVLLLFLVGVAAWASIFLDDGLARFLRDDPNTRIAASPDTGDATLSELADNEPEDVPDDAVVVAALPGPTTDIDEIARDPLPEAQPAELSADEARARYAATGIWQMAPEAPRPPEIITLEDFYLTSIDPKVIEQDAVALPDSAALLNDGRPPTPGAPPAPGTEFRLDQRGLVQATADGTLTPEGVRVFAGKPPLLPPDRPGATEAPTDAEATADPALAQLAALRPKARPGDLAEQNERSTLGGRTRTELAALRPKLRPKSAQELAEQAAAASTAAVEQADPEAIDEAVAAAVETPDPFAGATAQAVAASLKPKTRPSNFDRIVKRSEETVQATPVPASQKVKPSAPTATTVARAATEQNALKLRRVNLIGVYGTPSNRRALVRLANGRYKKVKVGDRLDGGRVNAIGDSELRYVKGGRNVTLKMPRG